MPASRNPLNGTEILVTGAGPAGLSLALALARAGFETTVSDGRAVAGRGNEGGAGGGSKVYLVAAGCWRIFKALDMGDALKPYAEPVHEVAAAARSGGAAFHGSDAGEDNVLGYVIEADALESVLGEAALSQTGLQVLAPDRLVELDFQEGHVGCAFESGAQAEAKLVVGCDGARSVVREWAGIAFEGWDYSYRAVSTVMKSEIAHEGRARQMFLSGGPIAALPMTEGRVNVVWSVKASVAEVLTDMSDEDFEAELARQAEGFLPGAKLVGPRASFPLGNRIAERFHGHRLALAGDAAHVVHPLAGQGLNLGLKDVAALVDVIGEAARVGLDIGSEAALAPYTQWRRTDVVATAAAMEGFHRAFTGPAPVRGLAAMAMEAAGAWPEARKLFAMEAAGVLGETPSMMREPEFADG